MLSETKLPDKCRGCAKSRGSSASEECDFCGKIGFPESILCDLNRSLQEPGDFSCHAFLPMLKSATLIPVGPRKTKAPRRTERSQRAEDFQGVIFSEKFKYEKALFLQKLNRDPDLVSMNLKFHFAWNVTGRRPLFSPHNEYFGFVQDTFLRCSDLVGGFSKLIWLAPDHVHVYLESDGLQSPETMLKRIKEFSEKEILKEFPDFKGRIMGKGGNLWDEAYFVETVG